MSETKELQPKVVKPDLLDILDIFYMDISKFPRD